MTSRERVLKAISFQETDRIPIDSSGRDEDLMNYYNFKSIKELYDFVGYDIRNIWAVGQSKSNQKRYYKGHEANQWGVPVICGNNGYQELCPLYEVSSVDEVEAYQWPDADDLDFSYVGVQAHNESNAGFFINSIVWAPIFHDFTWMCGYENCLALLLQEPEISKAVLRKITDFWIEVTKRGLEAGKGKIDCVLNCNDFGTQNTMIMSLKTWREFIKPELKRLYDCIKSYDAKVCQHSCGSIIELIPDLIEIGMDILDPVQVAADGMDPEILSSKFGGKISFHGGIDTQFVLPCGTEEEVRAEVRRMIKTLGSQGGYILCGSQSFLDDIPIANIAAMYDEAKRG